MKKYILFVASALILLAQEAFAAQVCVYVRSGHYGAPNVAVRLINNKYHYVVNTWYTNVYGDLVFYPTLLPGTSYTLDPIQNTSPGSYTFTWNSGSVCTIVFALQ